MNTVQSKWELFEQFIHPDATAEQRKELKKVFFAGNKTMLDMILEIDEKAGSAEVAGEMIKFLDDELKTFAEQSLERLQ